MVIIFLIGKRKCVFSLGVFELYLALRVDEPPTPTELSTPHEIIKHER
jgi:hypothetical protein